MSRTTGKYLISSTSGEEVRAFVPDPLPPRHAIEMNEGLNVLLSEAENSIQKLNIAAHLVLSQEWLLYGFIRKEALVSSQIEGTQATLVDLLSVDDSKNGDGQNADIEEVCNYLSAFNYAWNEMTREEGLPLSLRLLKNTHALLLKGVRGSKKSPGEFRQSQNWVGGSRPSKALYVPPPPLEMMTCLDELEKYFHNTDDRLPVLVRIGMIHVQFETIHPFLDGNGRIGRLLIALLLKQNGMMDSPLLYLSLYFKENRSVYYDLLNRVRTDGDWEGWIKFFLTGVKLVSEDVVQTASRLHEIVKEDRRKLMEHPQVTVVSIRLLEGLPQKPIFTVAEIIKKMDLSAPPLNKAVNLLIKLGLLTEVTGKRRDRVFKYETYLNVLAEGTEAI